jgi:xylulose-5-phosphate/fructose-6-phosphate phosphoketolase
MENCDLKHLFKGYGYKPIIVEGDGNRVYKKMIKALDKSYTLIRKIQKEAREIQKENLKIILDFL